MPLIGRPWREPSGRAEIRGTDASDGIQVKAVFTKPRDFGLWTPPFRARCGTVAAAGEMPAR